MKLTPLKNIINLEGKTAIVTGGAMGIGFGIAYRLAEAGAKIVIADLNEDAGNKAAKVLTDDGFKLDIKLFRLFAYKSHKSKL